ncbi:MAG: ferrochelatase [Elusimicrobia bacterium]|nr:ferrochelatase [Elusimicrobiota bacterium]
MANSPSKAAALLMAHGAPKDMEDVPAFLARIYGGRPATESALREAAERYERIGGRSPLMGVLTAVAGELEKALFGGGFGVKVYLGMRYSEPSIEAAVSQMLENGHTSALALPLSPYQSSMTDEAYLERARAAVSAKGASLALFSPPPWNAHPMLVGAFSERLRESFEQVPAPLKGKTLTLFTGHSLPQSVVDDGDPYAEQLSLSAAAVAQEAGVREFMMAYQSVPASAEGKWLGPDAGEILEMAAKGGIKAVLMHPIGFLIDCLETLYEDDIRYRAQAESRGMAFVRVPALNDDPLFVCALAAIIRSAFAPLS